MLIVNAKTQHATSIENKLLLKKLKSMIERVAEFIRLFLLCKIIHLVIVVGGCGSDHHGIVIIVGGCDTNSI